MALMSAVRCTQGVITSHMFYLGFMLGMCVTFLCLSNTSVLKIQSQQTLPMTGIIQNFNPVKYHREFDKTVGQQVAGDIDLDIDKHIHEDDDELARKLRQRVKFVVWVMTSPTSLQTKAKSVRDTWGKRCDQIIFFSSQSDPDFPAVGLNVSEGREHLTSKTMAAFTYLYKHYFHSADWFMKRLLSPHQVDDDTFVIPENLRYFLSDQNSSQPIFFGQHFDWDIKQGYYSGGAGYVISKEALRRYGESASGTDLCKKDGGSEDKEFARCMEKLGVRTTDDSTDAMGRTRFHCFPVYDHLAGAYPQWYLDRDTNNGTTNVSDYAISFHYISPEDMYSMEFYIYHLRPYGVKSKPQNLNRKSVLP